MNFCCDRVLLRLLLGEGMEAGVLALVLDGPLSLAVPLLLPSTAFSGIREVYSVIVRLNAENGPELLVCTEMRIGVSYPSLQALTDLFSSLILFCVLSL